jgi:hypothetical protein
MKEIERKSLIKKLPFYCSGENCYFIKRGQNKKGSQKYGCTHCGQASFPLKNPIDFSTWTEVDKILDKEESIYHYWKRNFDLLKTFYETYGHTWPSKNLKGENRKLRDWASHQRTKMRRNLLHHLKVQLLQSINFSLDYYSEGDEVAVAVRQSRNVRRNLFQENFKKVLAWKKKHGRWPNRKKDATQEELYLANILSKWRLSGQLYKEEMVQLDGVDFIWNLNDQSFFQKIERIKAFKEKFGGYYLVKDKDRTRYDFLTYNLISMWRNELPKEKWKSDQVKALKLGAHKNRKLK